MALSFSDLIEIGNDAVPFRKLYDSFNLEYRWAEGNTQCKCPFHGADKHPSARIYEDTNSWYCFTCGFSKTPIFFFKSMIEKPLTDSVAEFFRVFGTDIRQAYPDLAGESFSLEDIQLAYYRHLGEDSGVKLAAQRINTAPLLEQPDIPLNLPIASPGVEMKSFYLATKPLWRRYYNSPNFLRLYLEFVRHLNVVSNKAATEKDAQSFNEFLANLQRNFKVFAETA